MEIEASLEKRFGAFALDFRAKWSGGAVFLGPNGSGKSTTLRCMAGVYVCRGYVKIDGVVAESSRFYYVPPAPKLPPTTSVGEYLQHLSQVFQTAIKPRFGVEDFLDKRGAELSSGMAARVFLTVAVSVDRVILLDEPLSYLETKYRLELVKSLAGRPFVVATHDPAPFLVLKPTLMYIEGGRVSSTAGWDAVRALYVEPCGGELCTKSGEVQYVVGYL